MGEQIVSHATPADLTPQEKAALEQHAHEVEREIHRAKQAIFTAGIYLAKNVYELIEQQLWRVLGYESLNHFLASPDIELSKGHALKLTRIYRELVVDRGVPTKELVGVDLEKVQLALPAIKAGKALAQDAIADAKSLTRGDMAERYSQADPNAKLAAEDEPERATCPTCRSWVAADRLKGAA